MYNFFLEKIVLPLGDIFNGSSYIKELKYWRKVDKFSSEELQKLQQEKLAKLLNHAVSHVDFYQKEVSSPENQKITLSDFPIITKDILRNNADALISNLQSKENLIPYSSSGSTGVQTTVYLDKKEQSLLRGALTHWWEWSDYKVGNRLVQTGITPNRGFLKSMKDVLYRTIYINAFSHTQDQLKEICAKVSKKPNQYHFAGYASSLNVIAEYALENQYDLKLNGVISLGDKLFDHYKKNIKKAFKAEVIDTYGSNEGVHIAAQKDLDYYYILSPHVVVEILDDENNPVPDGEMGHIIVTKLDGYAMPLIRYKIGDLGIKLPIDQYPKKREFAYPLLQQVVGRETDIVVLPNNGKLVVHSFTGIFEYIPEIKQFKVIQEERGGITIEYIEAKVFSNDALKKAENELRKYIKDDDFYIRFKQVEYIAPSKSGKPQIVESRIKA